MEMTLEDYMKIPHVNDKKELKSLAFEFLSKKDQDSKDRACELFEYIDEGIFRTGEPKNNVGYIRVTKFYVSVTKNGFPRIRTYTKKVNIK